jgi:hypothetical protein
MLCDARSVEQQRREQKAFSLYTDGPAEERADTRKDL